MHLISREDRQILASLTPERIAELKQSVPMESVNTTRKGRKVVDRTDQWPDVGAVLEGQFLGDTFRAEVVKATKYKSGKALRLLTAPVKGTVCRSYSSAQDVVTLAHRQKMGVKGKTGLSPAWNWWKNSDKSV